MVILQSIREIAESLNAEAFGDLDLMIETVAEPAKAKQGHLALAMDASYELALKQGHAEAAILWQDADWQKLGLKAAIIAPRARYVLSGVSYLFEKKPEIELGIHPTAIVDPSAKIGKNAAIGAFCIIGSGVIIGDNLRMLSHSSIAENTIMGDNALLYSGVRIGARIMIGDGFISQSNTVIGADGFSYVTPEPGAVEKAKSTGEISKNSQTVSFARINSLGGIVIGNDVEMGANCAIDRGTIANTCIGNGTKIDNLVHIGHNVIIGETCLICGQVGIAGSSSIGDRVVLGGQVGVADHIRIGSDVIVAGKSGISSHVPSGRIMMGSPAMKMQLNIESYKALRRLPRLFTKVAELQKRVFKDK